jgi:hypothetical protein
MSALQSRLKSLLKGNNRNSTFQMFDSLIYQWGGTLNALIENKQGKLIYSVGKINRGGFYWLFAPFKDATNKLETTKVATLCLMI